jgi:uncharacterized protein GlcG (DUF336 family)
MSREPYREAVIDHRLAGIAVAHAVAQAEEMGIRVCAAVTDVAGRMVAFLRMPGTFLLSGDLALKKATSAAGLGLEPTVVETVLAGEHERVRQGLLLHPGFTEIRGGAPIRLNGELIGGIGVSGGSEAQDQRCAAAALAAVQEAD